METFGIKAVPDFHFLSFVSNIVFGFFVCVADAAKLAAVVVTDFADVKLI